MPEKRQSEQYVKDMKRSACSISATSLGLRGISDIIAFEGATQVPYAERRALALQGMIFLPGFDAETEIHWRVSKETVRRRPPPLQLICSLLEVGVSRDGHHLVNSAS